jgi:hypothetical protein
MYKYTAILPRNFDFQFEELQIYGNAHIAFLPKPFDHGVKLHFQHMIGDRTGFVHIGNHQVMDLRRNFIDTPFSTYVYDGGYRLHLVKSKL